MRLLYGYILIRCLGGSSCFDVKALISEDIYGNLKGTNLLWRVMYCNIWVFPALLNKSGVTTFCLSYGLPWIYEAK